MVNFTGMDMALILEAITRHIKLEKNESDYFLSLLNEKTLKRRQYLLNEGEVCKTTAFVLSGCLRSYSVDRNGFEHILQFAPRGWWIADIASLITKQPAKLNIDALEDSEILLLTREDQLTLFDKVPKFERFFRVMIENSIAANHNRLLDYMGLSAMERYEMFCKRYPMLVQTLPQKQIAYYLGVTPEFLSKMKAEMLRKK